MYNIYMYNLTIIRLQKLEKLGEPAGHSLTLRQTGSLELLSVQTLNACHLDDVDILSIY